MIGRGGNDNIFLMDLLLDISLRLNRAQPHETDGEIDEVLELVTQKLGLYQSVLLLWPTESGASAVVKCYPRSGSRQAPPPLGIDDAPWLIERLQNREIISLSRLPDDLPASAERDRQYVTKANIRSVSAAPIQTAALALGGLVAFSQQEGDPFSEGSGQDIVRLAEMLAGVLSRKREAERMDDILAYEHLLSDISATYINLPTAHLDKTMSKDLGRLARLLGADRCILYLAEDDGETFRPYLHSGWWPEEDREQVIKHNRLWVKHDPEFIKSFRYLFKRWRKGEHVQWSQLDHLPPDGQKMKEAYRLFHCKSQLSVPVSVSGSTAAVLTVSNHRVFKTWSEDLVPRLRLFGEVFANALSRKRSEEALQKAFAEVRGLKERFEADYIYLRDSLEVQNDFKGIIGKSDALRRILTKVKQVAPTDVTVLLLGETGTGKGLIARTLHNESKRRARPLMQVNCAALSPNLIESELFGHEKGAFTGAASRRIGRFESARGTSLFLDEVAELPLELQAKLLRVLQDGEFERIGGSATIRTDARIVAATNRNLEEEVKAGRFRRDLYYRLNIFPIHIPPLRERVDDIPLFVSFFVEKYGKWMGKKFDVVPQKALRVLEQHHWPGNIRELENLIERAVISSPEGDLRIDLPPAKVNPLLDRNRTLEAFEREYIAGVLQEKSWKVKGESGAAESLGLKPSTLRTRMEKLGIKRPNK